MGASIQVDDGVAVTYDENGGPSEPKSVWDCFSGAKDYISNGVSQGISNVKDEWNNIIGDKHIILGRGSSTSATAFGGKEAVTISKQYDTKNGDTDILVTGDAGGGTGLSVTPVSGSIQLTVADNRIPDMYGNSDSGGFTLGPFSFDVSADHATTYAFNFGGEGVEVHGTKSYTYSKKDVGEQFSNFGDGYMQYIEDQITGQTDQDTNLTEEEKQKKKLNDEFYGEIENACGYKGNK